MTNITDAVRRAIGETLAETAEALHRINKTIHDNPELGYQERIAHDTICSFLETEGFRVTRHAHGLETSFEAEMGQGGRLVVFCAEYDALPGIGHGCGHNLIATSAIASFLSLCRAVQKFGVLGRVRIIGTPAEEGGGGKVKLVEAGAFKDDIAAAIMAHPSNNAMFEPGFQGLAGFRSIASHKLRIEYHGRGAHAGGDPWDGINALDAAVAAYNNISMLRQHIKTDERIHGVIEAGGEAPNVIPHYTRMNWYVRSPNSQRADLLLARAKACLEAGAAAAGCTFNYITAPTYKDLLLNESLCAAYVEEMAHHDRKITLKSEQPGTVSTDMGNVSYEVPGFHGVFGIPTERDVPGHSPRFAEAASKEEAHQEAILSAKGMAMMGWRVLTDDALAADIRREFEQGLAEAGKLNA